MPQASPTKALFARAAAKVADVFGERDDAGELDREAVVIRRLDGSLLWQGLAIVSPIEVAIVEDGGDLVKAYTGKIEIPAAELSFDGIPAQVTVEVAGSTYAVADTGSKRDANWLTLSLQGDATTEHTHLRRG